MREAAGVFAVACFPTVSTEWAHVRVIGVVTAEDASMARMDSGPG